MDVQTDWSSTFFSGLALETCRDMFPSDWTLREADGLARILGASTGARVLDVPCGSGRLSIELASRGLEVTGIDLVPDLVEDARRRAEARGVRARFVAGDMRDLPFRAEFDGAFCFGNSFAYFDDEGNERFLRSASRALRPGGTFVLHAPLVAEVAFSGLLSYHASTGGELGGIVILRQGRYEPALSRAVTEYTFIRGTEREKKAAAYRVYTFAELSRLLRGAGFAGVEGVGSLEGEPFALGSKDCYLVARNGG